MKRISTQAAFRRLVTVGTFAIIFARWRLLVNYRQCDTRGNGATLSRRSTSRHLRNWIWEKRDRRKQV